MLPARERLVLIARERQFHQVRLATKVIFGVGKLLFWLIFGLIGASLGGGIGALIGIGAVALFGIPGLLTVLIGAAIFMGIGRVVRGIFMA